MHVNLWAFASNVKRTVIYNVSVEACACSIDKYAHAETKPNQTKPYQNGMRPSKEETAATE